MKVYKIKHIKSGLYYRPVRKMAAKDPNCTLKNVKSNLAPNGKIYNKLPDLYNIMSHGYRSHLDCAGPTYKMLNFNIEDWTIEEFDLS